jgi:hypothetical protein
MDNFNLKQFLIENKLTENSKLSEIKVIPNKTITPFDNLYNKIINYIDNNYSDYDIAEDDIYTILNDVLKVKYTPEIFKKIINKIKTESEYNIINSKLNEVKLQPGNTGLSDLNKPVDIVSREDNGGDGFEYVDIDKLKKELKYKYFNDLFDSPQTFNDALLSYLGDIVDFDEPGSYKNMTLKELIEDFRLWFFNFTTD